MAIDSLKLQQLLADARRYRAFRSAGLPNGLGVYDEELDSACDQLAEELEIDLGLGGELVDG